MDIGELTGVVSIEDQLSGHLTQIANKVREFATGFDGAMGLIAESVVVATAAIVGMGVSIVALGEKGSTIIGVQNAFDHLAESAGTTGEAIRTSLTEGVKGTIDQFQLMKDTSKLLGSGMKLNTDQALLMGQAARELGKATGGDASSGLEMMSQAMTTGRVRGLQQQIGLIDLKKGEQEFAKSIGTTVDQLNEAGKLEGKRIAILQATQTYLDRLGVSELSFKERLQQATTAVEEWADKLATSVASSPNVLAALDSIQTAINATFGTTGQDLMDTIMGLVNSFADAVASAAPTIIDWMGKIKDGIAVVYNFLVTNQDTIKYAIYAVGAYAIAWGVFSIGSALVTGVVGGFTLITGSITLLNTAFMASTGPLALLATGLGALVVVGGSAIAVGYALKVAWDWWGQSAQAAKDATWQAAANVQLLANASKYAGKPITDLAEAQGLMLKRVKELNNYQQIVTVSEPEPGSLPDNSKFIKDATDKAKAIETATAASITKTESLWDEYFQTIDKISGDSLDAQLAGIQRWYDKQRATLDATQAINKNYQNQLQALDADVSAKRELAQNQSVDKFLADWQHIHEETAKISKKNDEEFAKSREATLKVMNANTASYVLAEIGAQKQIVVATTFGQAAELLAIQNTTQAKIDALSQPAEGEEEAYARAVAKIKELQGTLVDALYVDNQALSANSIETLQGIADKAWTTYMSAKAADGEFSDAAIQHFKEVAEAAQKAANGICNDLGKVLSGLSSSFSELANISGGTFGAITKQIGTVLSSLSLMQKGIDDFNKPGATQGEQIAGAAGAVAGGASAIMAGTAPGQGKVGGAISGGLSGMATGAMIGSIVPGIGTAIGAVIGGIGGAITGLLRNMGPSEAELGARSEFQKAQLAGETLDQTIKRISGSLVAVGKTGPEALSMVQTALDATHTSAADVDAAMKKINDTIAKTKAAIGTATTSFGAAFAAPAAAYGKKLDLTKQLGDVKSAAQAKIDSGGTMSDADRAQADDLTKQLKTQQDIIDVTTLHSQAAATAMGASISATFNAALLSGQSFTEAIKNIGPAVANLETVLEATGFKGGAAFLSLQTQVDLANDKIAGPALDSVNALADGIGALATMGKLDQDTFAGLATQITGTFNELVAKGDDGAAVLISMQKPLQTLWQQEQDFGLKVDEATQALIDESVNAGIVGEKHKTSTDQMIDALKILHTDLEGIVEALTGKKGVTDAFHTLAEKAKLELATIPKGMEFTVKGKYVPPPDLPTGGYLDPTQFSQNQVEGAATGGRVIGGASYFGVGGVIPFTPRGTDTVPIMATPGETIDSVSDTQSTAASLKALSSAMDQQRQDQKRLITDLPRAIGVAVGDAIQLLPKKTA